MFNLITSYLIVTVGIIVLLAVSIGTIAYSINFAIESIKDYKSLDVINRLKSDLVRDLDWIEYEFPEIAQGLHRALDLINGLDPNTDVGCVSIERYREELRSNKRQT